MKCLIVDPVHEALPRQLKQMGFEPVEKPDIAPDQIAEALSDCVGLIVRSKVTVTAELIRSAHKLKFVARAGSGLDNIDVYALKSKGIALLSAPEGNRDAVGERTLGLVLALLNKIHLCDARIRQGIWDREAGRGLELGGKTVGIIGYGNMGAAFARRLLGFGCRVISYDKSGKTGEFAQPVDLEQLREEADIVSLHIPLEDGNRGLCDDAYLSAFKKNIFLVNTSRGEIVPLAALCRALKSGKVRGAALDVLENEKLHSLTPEQREHFDYLCSLPQVVLSPHVAGWSIESYERISLVLAKKIQDWLHENPL